MEMQSKWMWRRFGASYRWTVFVTTSIIVGGLYVSASCVLLSLFYGFEQLVSLAGVCVVGWGIGGALVGLPSMTLQG